jgi:hypothetical protein
MHAAVAAPHSAICVRPAPCRIRSLHLGHPVWVATVPADLGPILAAAAPTVERLSLRGSWVAAGLGDIFRLAGPWPKLRHLRLETTPGQSALSGSELAQVLAAAGGFLETIQVHSAIRMPAEPAAAQGGGEAADEDSAGGEPSGTALLDSRTASVLTSLAHHCPVLQSCVLQGSSDAVPGDLVALAASIHGRRLENLTQLSLVGAIEPASAQWPSALKLLRDAVPRHVDVSVRGSVLLGARAVVEPAPVAAIDASMCAADGCSASVLEARSA